jgi:predicted AAA+ superfamily ATPase
MIVRDCFFKKVSDYAEIFPICAIIGPRQCGKTTLALEYAKKFETYHRFDLEDPQDFYRLQTPKLAFKDLKGLIIIDEIQRMPDLFPYLRVHVDLYPDSQILILGSASPDLIRQSAESLAGRIGYVELTPFYSQEVGFSDKLWLRGGFPKSYLAPSDKTSKIWLSEYIRTFLERDLRAMGFNIISEEMRKLWTMVAHYHGNLVNYSELGRSLNLSDMTIRKYLQILESSFMVRLLRPWHENISKRQVKNPKVYIRDSGIFHRLLGITPDDLSLHPKVGASWEGFALEEITRLYKLEKEDCYFWRTHDGAELDLLVYKEGKKIGFEFKYGQAVKISPSMKSALEDLKCEGINVIIPGNKSYPLHEKIHVQGIETLLPSQTTP